MDRVVEPELLDTLPADNADASESRRDLRRINRIMGHARRWPRMLKGLLPLCGQIPWRVVALGAVDATLTAQIWVQLPPPPPGSQLVLLDQLDISSHPSVAALEDHGWEVETHTAEAQAWLEELTQQSATLIYANLFLHHFDANSLGELLRRIARQSIAFACLEPRRSSLGLLGVLFLPWIRCNSVTRHDAQRSVRAGFRHREISEAWPAEDEWSLKERTAGP